MKPFLRARIGVAMALAMAAGGARAATNLLTNGDFETGDFTGWTLGGVDPDDNSVTISAWGFDPEQGYYQAELGSYGGDGTLSQTISDTAGQTYSFSFWLASEGGGPSDFKAQINGATVLSLHPAAEFAYTEFVYSFIGTGLDTLTFQNRNDPNFEFVDNVSVTMAGVPEPAAWSSMLLGLGLSGAALRRRRALRAVV